MSAHLARGPLSSPLGQWAVLGLGVFALAGKENLSAAFQRAVQSALQAAGDGGALGSDRMLTSRGQSPIIIHSGPSSTSTTSGGTRYLSTLVQLTVGAGACWATYAVFTTCLPDAIKELLPVTRKFFDNAVASLGRAIIGVRDALAQQIDGLSKKQDELSAKQDATHGEVLAAREDLGDLRLDIDSIHASVTRCESSLAAAQRRQTFTARGVRLLVKCVGTLLPGNATLAGELDRFGRDAEEMIDGDEAPPAAVPRTAAQVPSPRGKELRVASASQQREEDPQQQLGGECNPQQQTPQQTHPSRKFQHTDSIPECTENEKRVPSGISQDMNVETLLAVIRSGGITVQG